MSSTAFDPVDHRPMPGSGSRLRPGMPSDAIGFAPGSRFEVRIDGADELVRQQMIGATRAILEAAGLSVAEIAAATTASAMPGSSDRVTFDVPRTGPPFTLANLQKALAEARAQAGAGARQFVTRTQSQVPAGTTGSVVRIARDLSADATKGHLTEAVLESADPTKGAITAAVVGVLEPLTVIKTAAKVVKGLGRVLAGD